jgi:hypothetical protein
MRVAWGLVVGHALWAGAALAAVAGCGPTSERFVEDRCSADAQCNDGNPCTQGLCDGQGLCVVEPLPDQALGAERQVVGDCTRLECVGGSLRETFDGTDFEDDANDCTRDTCSADGPAHFLEPAGTACGPTAAPGFCGDDGVCYGSDCLLSPSVCDDGNACTDDSCDEATGGCRYQPLDGVPLGPGEQIDGDCKVAICQAGAAVDVTDNTDLPVDGLECTEDICNNGIPSNPNLPLATSCGDGSGLAKLCDGSGVCVECNGPADCSHLPVDDECQTRTCGAGMCGQTFTAIDTPLSGQTAGDCQLRVCDGAGGVVNNVDDSDLPVDGNDCTMDVCNGGVPSNPNEPSGTACGAPGGTCDGLGGCSWAACSVGSCQPPTSCRDHYCVLNVGCQFTDAPSGTACNDNGGIKCDGSGSCVECLGNGDCQGPLKCNTASHVCE